MSPELPTARHSVNRFDIKWLKKRIRPAGFFFQPSDLTMKNGFCPRFCPVFSNINYMQLYSIIDILITKSSKKSDYAVFYARYQIRAPRPKAGSRKRKQRVTGVRQISDISGLKRMQSMRLVNNGQMEGLILA